MVVRKQEAGMNWRCGYWRMGYLDSSKWFAEPSGGVRARSFHGVDGGGCLRVLEWYWRRVSQGGGRREEAAAKVVRETSNKLVCHIWSIIHISLRIPIR
jgi:hypothetical protein